VAFINSGWYVPNSNRMVKPRKIGDDFPWWANLPSSSMIEREKEMSACDYCNQECDCQYKWMITYNLKLNVFQLFRRNHGLQMPHTVTITTENINDAKVLEAYYNTPTGIIKDRYKQWVHLLSKEKFRDAAIYLEQTQEGVVGFYAQEALKGMR